MKITIAYQSDEEQQAGAVLTLARHILGKVKIKHVDRHKPYKHIYISKEPPATVDSSKKTLDNSETVC